MEKWLLDSHVFLDYFLKSEKEKIAKDRITAIATGKTNGIISTIALLEVKYRMLKKLNHDKAEEAMFLIKNMPNMEIINVDHTVAETAADMRFKYYKKNEKEMSYADAIHIATAVVNRCSLIITGDSDFEKIDEIKTEVY
ncbi:TPA: type II toxin-antitoxin system VapC family toxin [Candidatus Micrarchaeota archaeon]|nr:type II toxin-antitoxin system VapC family toxin [Candidatus Micrarchaeota archaeon]